MTGSLRTLSLRVFLTSAIMSLALGTAVAAHDPGLASAQTTPPPTSLPFVTVKPPGYTSGQVTITGIAVDCATGQPATRVAIYDGADPSSPYIADVSMDTMANVATYCPGKSGSARIGFTLIYNTNSLAEGTHALLFNAEFPGGGSGGTIVPIIIENFVPYEFQCRGPLC